MRSLPVIVNPTAGGGRLLRSFMDLDTAAHHCGYRLSWRHTEHRGHGTELARQAVAEGHRLVLAYGGDGTYNEVARGLLGSDTALGILPGGTTSVLAYEFDIPRPAPRALRALVLGRDRAMRVGRTDRGEIFLLMLSCGPDVVVLERLDPRLKRVGRTGIALQAARELLRPGALPAITVSAAGLTVTGGWAIVGTARCYGGPYHATPGADPFAATFEVVVQRTVGRRAALPFALGLPFGRHVRRRDVWRATVDGVELAPADGRGPLRYQLDGDLAGELPVRATIDPERLLVRLPGAALDPVLRPAPAPVG
ncbi:MAG TPA: diacylglycerol kinase family protein [Candidatus Sulfomarinibacteraceae bacterium]|nr:diacylglycerol kinase family protein [Candidatus Sulfomarinibacteraceae bacterium]